MGDRVKFYEDVFGEPPPAGRCSTPHVLVLTVDPVADGGHVLSTTARCRDCGICGWIGQDGKTFYTAAVEATDGPT
jgi:hypothetical protein